MKYKVAKKASEVTLEGVKLELDIVDGSLNAATFTDSKGNLVRLSMRSYSMCLEIPAPPEMTTKYRLVGTVLPFDIAIDKTYPHFHLAEQERDRIYSELDDKYREGLEVKEIEVKAED